MRQVRRLSALSGLRGYVGAEGAEEPKCCKRAKKRLWGLGWLREGGEWAECYEIRK